MMVDFKALGETIFNLPVIKNEEKPYRYYASATATPVPFMAHEPEKKTMDSGDGVAKTVLKLAGSTSHFGTTVPSVAGHVRSGDTGNGVLYTIASVKSDQMGIAYQWVLNRG